jgi:hypothetical protein
MTSRAKRSSPSLRLVAGALIACLVLPAAGFAAGAEPAPPYPAPPSQVTRVPPPRYYPPPPPRVAEPPPLSPLMRAVYAPFYAAGLVVRYGVYYVIVAPLEVFSRALSYGVSGGVSSPPPQPRHDEENS